MASKGDGHVNGHGPCSLYDPPTDLARTAHVASREEYEKLYKQSLTEPDQFWGDIAEKFFWKKRWSIPLSRQAARLSTPTHLHGA